MKKTMVAVLLLLGSVGIFAQAGTWYFSILPGYTFSSTAEDYSGYPYYHISVKTKNNFVGSLDAGYFFNDNIALHFGYMYSPGDYKARLNIAGVFTQEYEIDRELNVLYIGPEFAWGSKENQGYVQLNLGYTFGSPSSYIDFYGYRYNMGDIDNELTYGLAAGYRHYWGNVALNLQTTWTHVNDWDVNNFWDLRCGVAWRF